MYIVQQEYTPAEAGDGARVGLAVEAAADGLEAIEQALLVALGLELAHQPCARIGKPLVIQVDRILSGEHDANPKCPRLFEQGQQRQL